LAEFSLRKYVSKFLVKPTFWDSAVETLLLKFHLKQSNSSNFPFSTNIKNPYLEPQIVEIPLFRFPSSEIVRTHFSFLADIKTHFLKLFSIPLILKMG
jgi:hypothetical protein